MSVEVRGLAELANALKQLPAEIASKNGGPLARALGKAARDMAKDAGRRAPKGETGNLQLAIVAKRDRNPEKRNRTEAYFVTERRGAKGKVGRAYYAPFVEFGTSKQAAQPFMRPAFEAGKRDAVDTIAVSLREGIARAAKKLAKKQAVSRA